MSFFRRKSSSAPLATRLASQNDRTRLTRLIHSTTRRFLTSGIAELPDLLMTDLAAVALRDGQFVAAASFGWRAEPVAWLRTLLLDSQVEAGEALRVLLPPLERELVRDGITQTAVTLDEWTETWLRRPLLEIGYRRMVEVVGYEKTRLDAPSAGNQVVTVRRAAPDDLGAVLTLDRACFPLPWVKGVEIMQPAITTSPCFIVAEWNETPVGYAFVTAHHAGNLLHLVRIAVAPAFQGRGVGVRLLATIVDFARSRNAEVLSLNTQADNYAAQRLYEWFGFVRTSERQTVLGRAIGE